MKPKGKRGLADKIQRARPKTQGTSVTPIRRNPFELFLTKAKHTVAGRKSSANSAVDKLQKQRKDKPKVQIETQGLRSVSRGTAFQNRKKTLLQEYRTRTKNNQLIDRRLAENNASMSLDDKMMQRVMLERKRSAKSKKNMFNLNEDMESDDDNMGFGQTLADVERLEEDDEKLSDNEDHADDILGEKFVTEHHFGGGLLKKKVNSETESREESRPNLMKVERKLLVDDIIAESKQKKYDKQTELDEVREMTKSLDEKWRDVEVRKLISASFGQSAPEPPVESYDSLVKKLQFEDKAKASDRLKSDAELAREARDDLEKAEKSRREKPKHLPSETADGGQNNNYELGLKMLDPEFAEDDQEDHSMDEADDESDVSVSEPVGQEPDFAPGSEIPFVITVPKNRKSLTALFESRTPQEILTITTRIMKYHHISLAEVNREKLTKFFRYLLDFLLTKSDENSSAAFELWSLLTPSLHELFHISAQKGEELCRLRLEALTKLVSRKKYTWVPSAMMFVKFITICFPVDKHWMAVPSMLNLLLGTGLSKSDTRKSLLSGLFLATVTVEVVEKSKRYFPELIGFLQRCIADSSQNLEDLSESQIPLQFSLIEILSAGKTETFTTLHRFKTVNTCALLTEKLIPLYVDLPSFTEIFQPVMEGFGKIKNNEKYPERIREKCEKILELEQTCRKPRFPAVFFKKKPAPLKLLEPRIDDKFDRSKSAKKAAVKRLQHDKKRAVKSAKRELRRDNEFIARVQIDEQQKKDATRIKKVKELFTGLYSQEGEHKALQRQKNKMKSKLKF